MSGSGGGDPRGSSADLNALPPEIAKQSISPARVMLPFDAAVEAIRFLTEHDRRVESWEGWVRLTDGSRAKSLTHGGSFALSREPARAAESATAGIRRAHEHWERNPEYPGAALYFGITFGDAKSPT